MADTRDDERQRFLDRCFEFLKHVTTLSTAAALLILAIYREQPFRERVLALTLILIGLCVVLSVFGMQAIAMWSRKPPPNQTTISEKTQDAMIGWITTATGVVFIASVSGFALVILGVRFWPALWTMLPLILLLIGAILFVRPRRKRQVSDAVGVSDSVEPKLRREDAPPE